MLMVEVEIITPKFKICNYICIMTTAATHPDYELVQTFGEHSFYKPKETTNYHKSRELAMSGQDQFSRSGISPDVLQAFAQELLDHSNKPATKDTFRSTVAVIATNILLRLRNPVDELCAIRMGAIAMIHADEDPDKCTQGWIKRKMELAHENPNIFDFFLQMGIAFTPEYGSLLRTITAEDYLTNRNQQLQLVQPITQ